MRLLAGAKALFIPFNNFFGAGNKVTSVAEHFAAWPADKPVVTDARKTDLASILLLASLNNRSIHIAGVSTKDDILLIGLAKARASR